MGTRTFKVRAIHGETDLDQVTEAAIRNHRGVYPQWRSEEDLAEMDRQYVKALEEQDPEVLTDEQKVFRPSIAYKATPGIPPEPAIPVCDVIVDLDDGQGGRLTIDISDWEEAGSIKGDGEITVNW